MDVRRKVRQWIKTIMRRLLLPALYRISCAMAPRIQEDLVLFADARHKEFPEDMRLVSAQMQQEGFQVVSWNHDFSELSFGESLRAMLGFMGYYARARYVFLCDYYLPVVSVRKRRGTKVIQLWHACGAYKKFGYDAKDDVGYVKSQDMFQNFDLVAVSAERCRDIYANAFHLPKERVQALGVSRTDLYFSNSYRKQCREEFFALHPEAEGKKILLWAPTFRQNASEAKIVGIEEMEWLSRKLPPEWHIVKKLHPHAEKAYGLSDSKIPTERLYEVADVLVTDYSSVVFDFALTGKPMILFAPDYHEYGQKRGFYLELKELPARLVTEPEELLRLVVSGDYQIPKEQYQEFVNRHLAMCDGKATERIVRYCMRME